MSDEPQEIWRPIVEAPDSYEISNLGHVRSITRPRFDGRGTLQSRMMTPILNKGYPRVTLRIGGETCYRFPHIMVAAAFIGPCPDHQEVRHKNGDRANPALSNLEYGTRAQNIADCKVHGTFRNGASHLTEELVRQIASRHSDIARVLAEEYKVSISTIQHIREGRTWAHLNLPLRKSYIRSGDDHPARKGRQT
jgi:hypothetical protein